MAPSPLMSRAERWETHVNMQEYVEREGITVTAGTGVLGRDSDGWEATKFALTIKRSDGRVMRRVSWRQGTGVKTHPSESPADVMWALIHDARCGDTSFDEFCQELGYESDSRKAYGAWKACRRTRDRLTEFLGEDGWNVVLDEVEED